ncbi:Fpg/Nei family DNA glycosylase [Flavimarina sp. Hel_I_48]|uniref:Fpg/Nei family DNA glycosylase n=1 Tax=Flavimarina sp. Hel_I_48 TaxID=1392488 RepID=UPI0004DF2685|nr:DNA-formamidopyrimidine glycosylase family protein [Flavimarina sp. Hel_I_48]
MPELPEVTYYKKYVDATALHQEIVAVHVDDPKIAQASEKDFKEALLQQKLEKSLRHGKYVLLTLSNNKILIFHFGMSGSFEYLKHDELPKYAYFTLIFSDNSRLCFTCPRKFGKVFLAESIEAFKKEHNLGIDAMDLDFNTFKNLLSGKKGSIKGALLDQHLIAGIGNMYADEMLFQTKIHPKTSIDKLSESTIKALFKSMHPVLKTVINSQSQDEPLPKDYLTPHRKPDAPCPNGNGKVEKIKVSGRSTYFCPECQKEK